MDGDVYIDIHGASKHFGGDSYQHKEFNPGVGVTYEQLIGGYNLALMAGGYENSFHDSTKYLALRVKFNTNITAVNYGFVTGVADGYYGGVIPMLMPFVSVEYDRVALNSLFVLPVDGNTATAMLSLQIKLTN